MMQDLDDLNSASGMYQNQAKTMMTMFGGDTDKVWSKDDVEKFMNKYHSDQTLLEFLQ